MSRNSHKSIPGQFAPRLVELLEAPAYRVLTLAGRRVIDRVEIELAHHGGNDNGKLPVTFQDFVDYGIERHSIAPAIREAQALGLLEVTEKGRAGNAEWRKPNLFRLTYRPAKGLPGFGTNEWRRFETLEEARAVAQRARAQRAEKANDRWGNLPTFGGETPIENVNATAAKPALHDKVVKPTLLSISRGGSAEEPDREARPSGSAVASDPARMEGIEVVQNRIAQRIGRDGWNILGDLPIADLDRITLLECEGELTDGALADVLRARAAK